MTMTFTTDDPTAVLRMIDEGCPHTYDDWTRPAAGDPLYLTADGYVTCGRHRPSRLRMRSHRLCVAEAQMYATAWNEPPSCVLCDGLAEALVTASFGPGVRQLEAHQVEAIENAEAEVQLRSYGLAQLARVWAQRSV